jgi:hypothetical protein
MDTQHVLNPWNAQQLLPEKDTESPFRSLSTDSSVEEDGEDRLHDFYRFNTQDYAKDLERLHSRRQAHMRSWSYEETIAAASDLGDEGSDSEVSQEKRPMQLLLTRPADEKKDHGSTEQEVNEREEDNGRSNLMDSSATLVAVARDHSDPGIGMEVTTTTTLLPVPHSTSPQTC